MDTEKKKAGRPKNKDGVKRQLGYKLLEKDILRLQELAESLGITPGTLVQRLVLNRLNEEGK